MKNAKLFLRKRKVVKKKNVLTCKIPGLSYEMDLSFPPGKLNVCDKCKKIYKTRKLCRERDSHTTFPWNKTYICFVLDDSCFEEDSDGNECVLKGDGSNPIEFVAEHFECSTCDYFAIFDPTAEQLDPICPPCKQKNYTKTHCRVKHRHQNLPWNTLYMRLIVKKTQTGEENEENEEPATYGSKRKRGSHGALDSKKKMKSEDKSSARKVRKENEEGKSHLYSENRGDSKAFMVTVWNKFCNFQVSL